MFETTMGRGLLAVVLVAIVSNGRADDITYNIVDYPADENDVGTGGTDRIAGIIMTDGKLGVLTDSDILGGYWTLTNPSLGSFTTQIPCATSSQGNVNLFVHSVYATPTELLMQPGSGLCCYDFNPTGYTLLFLANSDPSVMPQTCFAAAQFSSLGNLEMAQFEDSDPAAVPGSIGENGSTWVIATAVPEPSVTLGLCMSLLGLGVVYLRQRRAH